MDEKMVVLMRGISGAGKTTLLQRLFPSAFICSATHYYMDSRGKYRYAMNKLQEAHKYCQYAFTSALKNGLPLIAVDNTNARISEMGNYFLLAKNYDYSVRVIRVKTDPLVAAERAIHGIPKELILNMHKSFEDYTGEEIITGSSF